MGERNVFAKNDVGTTVFEKKKISLEIHDERRITEKDS